MLPLLLATALAAPDVTLDGSLHVRPTEPVTFVPFTVPAGTAEIRVIHTDLSDANVLDWGLMGPDGFRGWQGSNGGEVVITELASTPGYVPGPLAGDWELMVGFADVVELPVTWHAEVTFSATASLPPDPDRQAWEAPAPIRTGPDWYQGDFHVHSVQSGDARPSLDEVAEAALARGLDFVELSEHNTHAHLGLLPAVQRRHPELLLVPGIEWTTYKGHANAIGVTGPVPFWVGSRGLTADEAAAAVADQGALLSPNHPLLDLGGLCIGCAWKQDVDVAWISGLEVQTTSVDVVGTVFLDGAIALWESWCDAGRHVAALGGSDDHEGGTGTGTFASPLGSPRTWVYAGDLSVEGILQGVRDSRTVIQLGGPDDPWVELDAGPDRVGDSVEAEQVELVARVTGGLGTQLLWTRDGALAQVVDVDTDPWEGSLTVVAPDVGETRVRVTVARDGVPRTMTSYVWVRFPSEGDTAADPPVETCGCAQGLRGWGGLWLVALAGLRRRSTRRSGPIAP